MKALYKSQPGPGAVYGDRDSPEPRPDELLIKVHRASICGSDLPIYHWSSWAPQRVRPPMVFGHEFCGTVERAGARVGNFKKGDFVSVESHIYCGTCAQCRGGQKNVCLSGTIIGIDGPGGFSQYAVVPARCAWKHKGGALKDVGSLMEPFGNAVDSVLVEEVKGLSVLVMGCGPQGLFSVAVAAASGAKTVVAVESSAFRAKLARRMGADAVIDPGRVDLLSAVLKAGRAPGGFDAVVEMSGSASAVPLALQAVRKGGRVTAFGIPPKKIEIDWANDVIFKGVRVYGIVGRKIFDTWARTDRLLRSIDVSPVITHTLPMKDFEQGFAVMSAPEKKCGKVILVP